MPTTLDSLLPRLQVRPVPLRLADEATARLSNQIRAGWRALIIEADDLGLLHAFNEAIRIAHKGGCLTSTSLRANAYAYEHAIEEILPDCPELGVGIHLCLNEAHPVAPRRLVPKLLGYDGHLKSGFCWLMKLARTRIGLQQIEYELRAQIERVLADGLRPDHLNSHMHVHMIPPIFRITCELANEYEIKCVRFVREPSHTAGRCCKRIQPLINTNYIKHLLLNRFAAHNAAVIQEFGIHTTDYFVGVNYTGYMDCETIIARLAPIVSGSIEVLLHPAIGPDPRDCHYTSPLYEKYIPAVQRRVELETLISNELPQRLQWDNWATTTFDTWTKAKELAPAEPDTVTQETYDRNSWSRSILDRFVPPRRPR